MRRSLPHARPRGKAREAHNTHKAHNEPFAAALEE
jgi:hypothetical protein